MPDITKCTGEGCPVRDECYRYTAAPSDQQSFFIAPPGYYITSTIESENGKWECEYYLPVKWEPTK